MSEVETKINENEDIKTDEKENLNESSEEISDSESSSDEERKIVAHLRVLKQDGQPERIFPIYEGITTIGRTESNDICLNYLGISSYHAKIEVVCNEHFIEDLHSTNYTHFGDVPIRPSPKMYQLLDNRKISFGRTKCIYEIIPVKEEELNSLMLDEKSVIDSSDETEIEDEIMEDATETNNDDKTEPLINIKNINKLKNKNKLPNENKEKDTQLNDDITKKYIESNTINKKLSNNEKNLSNKETNMVIDNPHNIDETLLNNKNSIDDKKEEAINEKKYLDKENSIIKDQNDNENIQKDEKKKKVNTKTKKEKPTKDKTKNKKNKNKEIVDNKDIKEIKDLNNESDNVPDKIQNSVSNKSISKISKPKKSKKSKKSNDLNNESENQENNMDIDEKKEIDNSSDINKINEDVNIKVTNSKSKRKNNSKIEKEKKNNDSKDEDEIIKNNKTTKNTKSKEKKNKKKNKKEENNNSEIVPDSDKQEINPEIGNKKKRKHAEISDNENSNSSKNSKIKLDEEKIKESNDIPRIAFTGIDDQYFKMVKDLGGIVEESWENCTHLVTDKIRRTVKFLCVLATGKKIVSINWVKASKKAGKFLDPSKYILKDASSEKKWKFSIKTSLKLAHENRNNPLFNNLSFYMTPNTKPPFNEMETIINAAGGKLLNDLPKKNNNDIIIISCPDDESNCKTLIKQGYNNIHTNEFILSGILRQAVDYKSYIMNIGNNSDNDTPTGGRKRKR